MYYQDWTELVTIPLVWPPSRSTNLYGILLNFSFRTQPVFSTGPIYSSSDSSAMGIVEFYPSLIRSQVSAYILWSRTYSGSMRPGALDCTKLSRISGIGVGLVSKFNWMSQVSSHYLLLIRESIIILEFDIILSQQFVTLRQFIALLGLGIRHGDLLPQNIVRNDERVLYIVDFSHRSSHECPAFQPVSARVSLLYFIRLWY